MKTLGNRQEGGGGEEGRERIRTEGEEEKKSRVERKEERKIGKKALARCFKPANCRSCHRQQMIPLNSNAAVFIAGN